MRGNLSQNPEGNLEQAMVGKTPRSEACFQSLFEEAPIAYHEIDHRGRITRVNQAECVLLGYSAPELLGKLVWELVDVAEQEASHLAVLAKISEKQPLTVFERNLATKQGNSVVVEVHETLIRNKAGAVVGIRSALIDITAKRENEKRLLDDQRHLELLVQERTRELLASNQNLRAEVSERLHVEEQLQEREQQYTSLFHDSPAGIYRSTPSGKILLANPSLLRMLGFSSFEELSGRDLNDPASGYDRDHFKELIQSTGEVSGYEATWYKADGSKIFVRENARAIKDENGEVLYYEGSVEDITEKKHLEAQLRHTQKMEAVGRLAGGVAHDFNNLLTVITGYGEVVQEFLSPSDPALDALEEVLKASRRAAALTRQLLLFSRQQPVELKTVDLNELISSMDKMLRRLIREDIELSLCLHPFLPSTTADANQIEQVVMNLVVNARDAMPEGGRIMIETSAVELDSEYTRTHLGSRSGKFVMISVSDSGCGMDAATQAKIFDPFFTTKELGKGTGLGLSTVYGIVKQHEGNVWVYSELGVGSTFKVYLPVSASEVRRVQQEKASSISHSSGQETVLLIEDDESLRGLITRMLIRNGYSVLSAKDGKEGLQILQEHHQEIQLLLTDMVLPGINGREIAKQTRVIDPSIHVLFMSGYTEEAAIHHEGPIPIGAFIQKPFTAQDLSCKVRQVLTVSEK